MGDDDGSLGRGRAVDGPQALLVHRQVDVGVAAPGVRVLALEAGVRQVAARHQRLGGQVVAEERAAPPPLVVEGAAVQRRPRALHRLGQHQHLVV